MRPPFNSYSRYLRTRYGEPVYRVAVDAGFSCPNRGPDRSAPGCTYCDEWGSRAPYLAGAAATRGSPDEAATDLERRKASLSRQIEQAEKFLQARYGPGQRILYFQAFSGTYGPVEELRELYDHALACRDFRELIVATRPDCIDGRTADLLAGYRLPGYRLAGYRLPGDRLPEREVWIELGLQSAHNSTLERVRRGHGVEAFEEAYAMLRKRGLKIAAHVIFGLPGETLEEMLATIRYLAKRKIDGIKIHNLHIPRGCALAADALSGELSVPCDRRHLSYVIRALELLPPETVIMRLTCDTPEHRLLMPRRFMPKARFYQELRQLMLRERTWQGRLYRSDR